MGLKLALHRWEAHSGLRATGTQGYKKSTKYASHVSNMTLRDTTSGWRLCRAKYTVRHKTHDFHTIFYTVAIFEILFHI
jgi:hypothetical protein